VVFRPEQKEKSASVRIKPLGAVTTFLWQRGNNNTEMIKSHQSDICDEPGTFYTGLRAIAKEPG
jgi:hypothetical protein